MYQTIIIAGNVGKEPEMRYTPSGQAVTNFNVATNRSYTGSDGVVVKETTWFRVSAWGKMAEATNQYLRKGSKVLVEGRLNSDPKTGGPRVWQGQHGAGASFEITASTVRFLSSREEDSARGPSEGDTGAPGSNEPTPAGNEDEIPF